MDTDKTKQPEKLPDTARRNGEVARTLAQAAMQGTVRALHTAQLALDVAKQAGGSADTAAAMDVLRNALLDAYAGIPERTRRDWLAAPGTIGGDELLDLLTAQLRGRDDASKGDRLVATTNTTSKE